MVFVLCSKKRNLRLSLWTSWMNGTWKNWCENSAKKKSTQEHRKALDKERCEKADISKIEKSTWVFLTWSDQNLMSVLAAHSLTARRVLLRALCNTCRGWNPWDVEYSAHTAQSPQALHCLRSFSSFRKLSTCTFLITRQRKLFDFHSFSPPETFLSCVFLLLLHSWHGSLKWIYILSGKPFVFSLQITWCNFVKRRTELLKVSSARVMS